MIVSKLLSVLRGLKVLGSTEMVRYLGGMKSGLLEIDRLRSAFPTAIIHYDVLLQGWQGNNLHFESGVRVEKGNILALGDELNGYGNLNIGKNAWIGQYNNFRLGADAHIAIGEKCLISQFCTLAAANHRTDRNMAMLEAPTDTTKAGISIGNDVWLGAGCVILPGVSIGEGAVIGANSVVTKTVPPHEIWAGVPAQKIGQRS